MRERAMCPNVQELHERLVKSGRLLDITTTKFDDDDHGTVASSALLRAVSKFFEE
jgi:hypothetical protein